MRVYPAGVDLLTQTPRFLTNRLHARRCEGGTRWRRLPADRQALLVLAHLRCGHTYAQLAVGVGVGVGVSIVYRYVTEAVDLLAARAPDLPTAPRRAFLILDGTLLPIDRIGADRPFYSGKHKRHGMNVQVLADPAGRLLWASPAPPGAVHDIRAARTHGALDGLAAAGIVCGADNAYQGAPVLVRVPFPGPSETALHRGQQAVNRTHLKIRALGEQAMGALKTWRLLRKICCSTTRITSLVQAVPTPHLNARQKEDYRPINHTAPAARGCRTIEVSQSVGEPKTNNLREPASRRR